MTSFELACAVLNHFKKDNRPNPDQLQAYLYLFYAQELKAGMKLFDDECRAYKSGMRFKDVHSHFWAYASSPISSTPLAQLPRDAVSCAERLMEDYGHLNPQEALELTTAPESLWSCIRSTDTESTYLVVDNCDIQNS